MPRRKLSRASTETARASPSGRRRWRSASSLRNRPARPRLRAPVASARAARQRSPSRTSAHDGVHRQAARLLDEVVLQGQLALGGQHVPRQGLEARLTGAREERAEEPAGEREGQHRGAAQRASQELVVPAVGAGAHRPSHRGERPVHALVVAELPVGVPRARAGVGADRLVRDEVVVGDGVGGQVGQEAQREGALGGAAGGALHVEADAPVVTMVGPAGQVLPHHDVGGERAVEEGVGVLGEERARRARDGRQLLQRLDREAQVGERTPGERGVGPGEEGEAPGGERAEAERAEGRGVWTRRSARGRVGGERPEGAARAGGA